MKLYGRTLSPFVRRVATSLHTLGMPFTAIPLSTVTDTDAIAELTPLGRVPVLELDDGTKLIDSTAILDTLDQMAGPQQALVSAAGTLRRDVLQAVALGLGVAEKGVAAYYERSRRPSEQCYEPWVSHCEAQARGGLEKLDALLGDKDFFFAGRLTQADITATIALDFVRKVLPDQVAPPGTFPALSALSARLNTTEAFRKTQP